MRSHRTAFRTPEQGLGADSHWRGQRARAMTGVIVMRVLKMAAATAMALGMACSVQAATFDLAADWSSISNPNGVWTLRQGTSALGAVPNWQGLADTAWAPSNANGSFLPAFFKASANGPINGLSGGCSTCDWLAGDVIVHTTDPANGIGFGAANVLFTTPFAGTANISGATWAGRLLNRTQDWQFFVNGALQTGGILPGDGSNGRAAQDGFALSSISLGAGDLLELRLIQNSSAPFGDFVGLNFNVDLTPLTSGVPEPASWAMMIAGFGAVGSAMRRRARVRGQSFA